jgi:ATP-dependent Lon protease
VQLDDLDRTAADGFRGLIVRKDLVRQFRGQFPVPTYVVEFMLGRYCATTDEQEIAEGLEIVRTQLSTRTVRADEDELIKSKARQSGAVRVIDIITARLEAKSDSYLATLPSLRLSDARIADELVHVNDRMLTGGFYAEIDLGYDATIAQERGGRPFQINAVRPIQLSTRGILDRIIEGRGKLTTAQWQDLLLRSVGLEPAHLSQRARDMSLLRMVPFVERNYNMVELGPRGTGKSHLFQQVSPYAHLVSGGKTTVARMFVNMANGQRGLVCQYDVVCFDEVSGVSFDQKDGVNIMKGYMESGEFSRGRESIRAEGSIVLVGNFDVDVQHQQRVSHLFGPLPPEMRNDTAFMDRIHSYLPGWDIPKVDRTLFTDHFGLVSDVLAEAFTRLRDGTRAGVLLGRVHFGGALSGRDHTAVSKTVSGLLKLLHPDPTAIVPDEDLEWAVRIALECRRRVKEQQKRIGSAEFRNTQFSYALGNDGVEHFVSTPELQSEDSIGGDPLPAGQIWAISPGGQDEGPGLYRIEVNEGPGGGVRILNQSPPAPFRESVRIAEQNLYARAHELVGERNPREHEFAVQLRSFGAAKSGADLGVAALIALCSALLGRPVRGGLVVVGGLNLGGSVERIHNPIDVVELARERAAATVLMPVACRRSLVDLSDEVAARVQVVFYLDAADALQKALHE